MDRARVRSRGERCINAKDTSSLCDKCSSSLSLLHSSRLLLRLYDPIGGCVRISGTPLTDINLKWWRQQIGYVSQEPCLFPGTIRDNIAAGKDGGDATDEEVEESITYWPPRNIPFGEIPRWSSLVSLATAQLKEDMHSLSKAKEYLYH